MFDKFITSIENLLFSTPSVIEMIVYFIKRFTKRLRLRLTTYAYAIKVTFMKVLEIPRIRFYCILIAIIFLIKLPFNRYVYYGGIVPHYAPGFLYNNIKISNLYNFICRNLSDYKIDIFLAQIAATLTTVSVLSILSDKSKTIYWDNIVHRYLVKPRFFNFYVLSIYSFVAIGLSLISILFKNYALFGIFAFLNYFFLGCLSLKMIGVYFGDKQKKKRLRNELLNLCETINYANKQCNLSTSSSNSPYHLMYDQAIKKYYDIVIQFTENTVKAIDSYDTDTAQENINFLMENIYCFNSKDILNIISLYNNEKFLRILLLSVSHMSPFSDVNDFYSGIYERSREGRLEIIQNRYDKFNEIYNAVAHEKLQLINLWADVIALVKKSISENEFIQNDYMINELFDKAINDITVYMYYINSKISAHDISNNELLYFPALQVWMSANNEIDTSELSEKQINDFYRQVKSYVK